MNAETKTFTAPTAAVLSLITGRMIPVGTENGFHEMQELAEWIHGGPIFTHQFASRELVHSLAADCRSMLPDDIAAEDGSSVDGPITAAALRDRWEAVHGPSLTLAAEAQS